MYIGKWAALLSVFWLLLSGFFQPLLLSFGVISVVLVLIVLKRMDDVDEEPRIVSSGHQIFHYLIWLFGQIMLSSVEVTKLIWGPNVKLSPTLATISANKVLPNNRVLYANSITLTPGTLCVDLVKDEVKVHALNRSSIDELKQGEMEKKITSIWGESP